MCGARKLVADLGLKKGAKVVGGRLISGRDALWPVGLQVEQQLQAMLHLCATHAVVAQLLQKLGTCCFQSLYMHTLAYSQSFVACC